MVALRGAGVLLVLVLVHVSSEIRTNIDGGLTVRKIVIRNPRRTPQPQLDQPMPPLDLA